MKPSDVKADAQLEGGRLEGERPEGGQLESGRSEDGRLEDGQIEEGAAPAIEVEDLTVAYHEKPALWDIDLALPNRRLTAIVGPNGAGKSTLIKAILGLVPKSSGRARIFGQPYREARRRVAYVPQRGSVDWDFPTDALDVVLMGRYGKLGWLRRPRAKDRSLALEALAKVGMEDYARRQISQLSGGQQQRVFLARALVQDADVYLMDEPFAGVDATTEDAILQLLRELRSRGKAVIVVHHDLTTVRDYFDHLVLLNVRVLAEGRMDETFTAENLGRAFGPRVASLAALSPAALDLLATASATAKATEPSA